MSLAFPIRPCAVSHTRPCRSVHINLCVGDREWREPMRVFENLWHGASREDRARSSSLLARTPILIVNLGALRLRTTTTGFGGFLSSENSWRVEGERRKSRLLWGVWRQFKTQRPSCVVCSSR